MNKYKALLTIAMACGIAASESVAVTYVDATTSNTTLADGTAMEDGTVGFVTNTSSADGLWNVRAFGNGSTIFEAGASGSEDAARIATHITGLTDGQTYEIYAYFWGADGGLWRGRTSLTDEAGDLQGYNTNHFVGSSFDPMTFVTSSVDDGFNPGPLSTADGSGFENGGYFDSVVLAEQDNRRLYQVSLGQVIVDGSGSVSVFIDDLVTGDQASRTWYDGVGYVAVPEPATTALCFAMLSLFALASRRSRKS